MNFNKIGLLLSNASTLTYCKVTKKPLNADSV